MRKHFDGERFGKVFGCNDADMLWINREMSNRHAPRCVRFIHLFAAIDSFLRQQTADADAQRLSCSFEPDPCSNNIRIVVR